MKKAAIKSGLTALFQKYEESQKGRVFADKYSAVYILEDCIYICDCSGTRKIQHDIKFGEDIQVALGNLRGIQNLVVVNNEKLIYVDVSGERAGASAHDLRFKRVWAGKCGKIVCLDVDNKLFICDPDAKILSLTCSCGFIRAWGGDIVFTVDGSGQLLVLERC